MVVRQLIHKAERQYELSLDKARRVSGIITPKRVLRKEWLTRQKEATMTLLPALFHFPNCWDYDLSKVYIVASLSLITHINPFGFLVILRIDLSFSNKYKVRRKRLGQTV